MWAPKTTSEHTANREKLKHYLFLNFDTDLVHGAQGIFSGRSEVEADASRSSFPVLDMGDHPITSVVSDRKAQVQTNQLFPFDIPPYPQLLLEPAGEFRKEVGGFSNKSSDSSMSPSDHVTVSHSFWSAAGVRGAVPHLTTLILDI